ncbi:hypothetical protein U9M48_015863 [Paspalum notatum var. saurae]|uniref:RelA/SpoT domain-containing protein n=1 Tax=Paspalum notatum var. saurae TaxID=547442 RepID=A0AAQ3T4E6_PASNO
MPPSIACSVKCRPHPHLAPQPPTTALELLAAARGAPVAADLRASLSRRRSQPSLSFSRSSDPTEPRVPCRGVPSLKRARDAVAVGADDGDVDGGAPALLLAGAQSRKLARRNDTASRMDEADRLRTVFLAMEDARAVLIKLADRLHNMRTLHSLPKIKQHCFAKETLEIFAPLANQLGISNWKEQLENLCFKYLYSDKFDELSTNLLEFYNRDMIAAATWRLKQALEVRGLSFYAVYGRHKSMYSIHSKMTRKKLAMDEIYDIHGVRVIVENRSDCFAVLELVHHLWPQIPGKFKDYISSPKTNGYQSLHTVVLTKEMLPLEIQIRTRDMHLKSEFGIAAHWRYKEGVRNCSSSVPEMVEWVRRVLTCLGETLHIDHNSSLVPDASLSNIHTVMSHSDIRPFSYSKQCDHGGPVLVILLENEMMSVLEVPQNSTVLDLLKRSSNSCIPLRIRLNCHIVHNWNQELKIGDVLELIPSPCKSGGYRWEFHQMFDHRLAVSQS